MSARLALTDRNRRAFVADLTHELRTPLAVIRGQAEAIGDGLYPGDQPHVAPILDAAQSLEALVDALPTLTMADVGGLRLKSGTLPAEELRFHCSCSEHNRTVTVPPVLMRVW